MTEHLSRFATSPDTLLSVSPERFAELLDMLDWYRRCLEDVIDRRPVRGLDEAKLGWDSAWNAITEAAR